MKEYEYDLFLSCSGEDLKFAKRLRTRLQKEYKGDRLFRVFLYKGERGERRDIAPGQDFVSELEKGLRASRAFGYILSPESVRSAWVQREYTAFLNLASEDPHRYIIPLRRRDCTPPLFVSTLQRIDFRRESQFEDGVRELLSIIRGDQPSPNSLPTHEGDGRNLEKLRKEALAGLENLALKGELELFVVSCLFEDGVRWEKLRGREQHGRVPHLFDIYNRLGEVGLRRLQAQIEEFAERLR